MFEVSFRRINGVPSALVEEVGTGEVNRVWKRPWRGRVEDWCTCDIPYGRCDHIKAAKEAVRIVRDRASGGTDEAIKILGTAVDELAALDKLADPDYESGQAEQGAAESEASQETVLKKEVKKLERELAATKEKHAREKGDLKSRISELRGGSLRARLEERADLESDMRKLKDRLDAARDRENQHAQALNKRDYHIKELEKELAESKRKVLTFDFLEAWCGLEDKLKPLQRRLMQSGMTSDTPSQLRELHQENRINEQQFMHLENMRSQRNDIVHHALLLTTSQARANLDILRQVIGQL